MEILRPGPRFLGSWGFSAQSILGFHGVIVSVEATATGAVEMKLLAKFNLILLVVFGAGGIVIGELAYTFLIDNARREVLAQGDLMMTSNGAVRDYTADDLKP